MNLLKIAQLTSCEKRLTRDRRSKLESCLAICFQILFYVNTDKLVFIMVMLANLEFRLVIFGQNIVPIAWKAEILSWWP